MTVSSGRSTHRLGDNRVLHVSALPSSAIFCSNLWLLFFSDFFFRLPHTWDFLLILFSVFLAFSFCTLHCVWWISLFITWISTQICWISKYAPDLGFAGGRLHVWEMHQCFFLPHSAFAAWHFYFVCISFCVVVFV